jgi:hypothetical protein
MNKHFQQDDCMEERFVAFIDILGFKNLVAEIEANIGPHNFNLKRIKSVLNFLDEESYEPNYSAGLPVYTETDNGIVETELGDPRLTYVSDCIIISAEPTIDGFKGLSRKIHKITADLAFDGIFCRGAISKGNLYHRDRIIFGSSYIKACMLEAKAVYPRVIIDPDILDFFDLTDGKMPLGPCFYGKDTDGYFYQRYWTWYLFPPYAANWVSYLNVVREHLINNAQIHRGNEQLLQKYEWLVDEYNSLVNCWRELVDGFSATVI